MPSAILGLPAILGLLAILAGLGFAAGTGAEEVGEEWSVASPEEVGLQPELITELVQRLRAGEVDGLDSLLVVRRGRLVVEEYFNGYGPQDLHVLRSATKSVVSMLVGIAIARGRLEGVEQPVLPFFPEYPELLYPDPEKATLTLENLLTMSPGLECNDFEQFSAGNEERMYPRADWIKFFLDLPLAQHPPGTAWAYCTAGVMTLGGVLENSTGRRVAQLSREWLFEPLGIERFEWGPPNRRGRTNVCGDLALRPRDMAKLGQLMLQNGTWRGKEVISRAWVERSTRRHIGRESNAFLETLAQPEDAGYGYLWWRDRWSLPGGAPAASATGPTVETFYATGSGGQKIFVFPDLDLVAVFTGSNFRSGERAHRRPPELLARYLLPAAFGEASPAASSPALPAP